MKIKTLSVLLLSFFVIMVLFGHDVFAEEEGDAWGPVQNAEPEGTEGFEESIVSPPTDESSATESAQIEVIENGSATESAQLEGVVDVDTYLNIRTSPWGKIVGGLRSGDKITILSKEGDWFKILNGDEEAYIHAYYVDAPGFPSHQGVEPPICGSDESPATGDPGSSATVDNGTFGAEPCTPMPSSVSSDFGPRDISVGSSYHEGIDLPVSNGTRLNALGNGVVTESGWSDGGGNFVRIRYDNGYSSFYCHLESTSVTEGQRVAIGQDVALSDNTGEWTTGAHLHMGITDSSGNSVNPRDVPGLEFPPLVE
ncbi:MAG: peptidoglycan DD-metalloendopeptidase family protein [Candidatus Riflebacteria bacterium]|nr:peptidoglycan DD-metalloendopeptidase family protein [Candidatus Riflebacteria bacterium]